MYVCFYVCMCVCVYACACRCCQLLLSMLQSSLSAGVQDWARPGDIHHMNIQWHTPSSAELDLVDKVLSTFLGVELDALDKFVKGEEMERCAHLRR